MANTKIQSEQIADSAIVADRLASDSVTTAKIADNVGLGGSPTTTTQGASDNSTKIATTAYVTSAIATVIDSAPDALNTLNELADALNDQANFGSTVTTSIAAKMPLAGGTFTGDVLINGTNKLGIGTAATSYPLEIKTSFPRIKLQDTDGTNQVTYIEQSNGATAITSQNGTSHGVFNINTYNGTDTVNIAQWGSDGILNQKLDLYLPDSKAVRFGSGQDFSILNDGSSTYLQNHTSNQPIVIRGLDGSTSVDALSINMNNEGAVTFSGQIEVLKGVYSNSIRGLSSTSFTQGTSGSRKLGTFFCGQAGQTILITYIGGQGYNANNAQNGRIHIQFRTSNNSSSQTSSDTGASAFYGSGHWWQEGRATIASAVQVKQISATEYDFYITGASFAGNGSVTAKCDHGSRWQSTMQDSTLSGTYLILPEENRSITSITTTGELIAHKADAQVKAIGDNTVALHSDAAWASNIFFGAEFDGSNQVHRSTSGARSAFKILALHDGDSSPQYLGIYGSNAGSNNQTVGWNTVGFAQDEDGNVGIKTTAPTETLHIGTGQANFIRIHNAASGDVTSGLNITRGDSLGMQLYDNPADDTTTLNASGNFNIRTDSTSYRIFVKDNGSVAVGGNANAGHSFEVQDRSDGYSMLWSGRGSSGEGRGLTTASGLLGVNSSQYDGDGSYYPVAGLTAASDNAAGESVDFWFGSTTSEWQPMTFMCIGAHTATGQSGQTAGWALIRATHYNNGISASILDSGGGGTFSISVIGSYGDDRSDVSRCRITYSSNQTRTVISVWGANYSRFYGATRS